MHKLITKKIAHAKKEHDKASRDGGKNITASLNCTTKDITGWENIILGSIRKRFVTTMGFDTMTHRSVTITKLSGSMFSPLTIMWKSRGSGKSALLRMPRGMPRSAV
eukprot:10274574-Ditylum_brightwellii.AAC.1